MSILQKINNLTLLLLLLIWPWQTRYFLVPGVTEYTTKSLYVTDLLVLLLVIFYVFGAKQHLKVKQYLEYFFYGLMPVALLAVAQFVLQATWSTKWLGLAKHEPSELGQVVIETAQHERWLRAYGSFDHPNILGGVMAVALMLVLIKKAPWTRFENISTALFSIALFVSFSRTAWLGLVVGILVFFILNFASSRTRSGISMIKFKTYIKRRLLNFNLIPDRVRDDERVGHGKFEFLVILFSIFALLSFIYSPLVFTRLTAAGRIEAKSVNERLSYYGEAKELFLAHPYLGVGYRNYIPALMTRQPGRPAWSYQPVHNTFVLVLVELGVVRLIVIIGLLWLVVRFNFRTISLKANPEAVAFLALMITLMLLDHWWWSLHVGLLLIGLLTLFSVRLLEENK